MICYRPLEDISSLESIEKGIGSAQQLTQTLEIEKIPCPPWVQEENALLHFNAAEEYWRLNNPHKAYQALSSAEQLLKKNIVESELLGFVVHQKECISKFLS